MAELRVAGIQHDISWERPDENFARLVPMIAEAVDAGARLVALTEQYSNGFTMNTGATAEPVDGPSTAFLVDQAARHHVWVCGSVPELVEGNDHPHNCLVVAGPDGSTQRYRKIHRFSYAGEDEHYAAGDDTLTTDIDGVRVSFFVCFDLRFAPTFWRVAPESDLYVVVANWPAARSNHWTTLLHARAIENQAYVLGVNRVGPAADGLAHSGDSRLYGPFGDVLAEAAPDAESVLIGDVDSAEVARVRRDYPFLGERID